MARAKAPAAGAAQQFPRGVVLTHPFGFYEDDGAGRFWSAGRAVTDPDEVRTLVERGAPLREQTDEG